MNIHEYQAKKLLADFGAPVAAGFAVHGADEMDEAFKKVPGPVYVVKAQIHAGGRGKGRFKDSDSEGGGVRVCTDEEAARKSASDMLGKVLVTKQTGEKGKRVNCVYIEAGARIERELYCSLLVNRRSGRVAFVASTEGGMDIEAVAEKEPDKVIQLDVNHNTGVDDSMVARLVDAFQLTGKAAEQAQSLFPALYRAFVERDMSLLEINPLVVLESGEMQVLDAKISLDANALFRHEDASALRDLSEEDERELEASKFGLSYIALDGNIGCMVNGAGLAMASMDIIKLYGQEPANFLDVGGGASAEKVTAAFKIITQDPKVKGILVNIFGGIMRCDTIAEGVVQAVKEVGLNVPLVVRLEGTKVSEGKKILQESGVNVLAADDLDDAAQKIVKAVA